MRRIVLFKIGCLLAFTAVLVDLFIHLRGWRVFEPSALAFLCFAIGFFGGHDDSAGAS